MEDVQFPRYILESISMCESLNLCQVVGIRWLYTAVPLGEYELLMLNELLKCCIMICDSFRGGRVSSNYRVRSLCNISGRDF